MDRPSNSKYDLSRENSQYYYFPKSQVLFPQTPPSELRFAIHTKVYTENSSPSLFQGLTPGAFGEIVKFRGSWRNNEKFDGIPDYFS